MHELVVEVDILKESFSEIFHEHPVITSLALGLVLMLAAALVIAFVQSGFFEANAKIIKEIIAWILLWLVCSACAFILMVVTLC